MQGVLTLPTIKLMERYPDHNLVEKLFQDRGQSTALQQVLDMINDSPVIDDCYAVIQQYCDDASEALQVLPDCDARRSLLELSCFTRERRY